jgi:ppGpp synthetase/RelA/SpoT-type nucleotidyltranferase
LGDRLKKGEISDEDVGLLKSYRSSFEEGYEEVVACIQDATQLVPTGRRAKSTSSIIDKLRRETIRLSQMQDIAGCRLVVNDVLVQDRVVERIGGKLAKAVLVDRRKDPSYGYRAVHIIATARNRPIEIQVRTELQHLWAQLSERLSDAHGSAIKYGGGDPESLRLLSMLSRMVEDIEDLETHPDTLNVARVMKPLVRSLVELATTVKGGR